MDVKGYILNKLFFPKTIVIDKPGIVISKTSTWYGKKGKGKRIIYFFEDIFSNLQRKTLNTIGEEKARLLFYKIGRDVGLRYVLLANSNKPPTLLLDSIIKYILNAMKGSGMSLAGEISFDQLNRIIHLTGKDNNFCRKSGIVDFWAGILVSLFNFLFDEPFSYEVLCKDCPNNCELILKPAVKDDYVPILEDVRLMDGFDKLNLTERRGGHDKVLSISDFYKFKSISIDENGKFLYKGITLFPTESGQLELITLHYEREGLLVLLELAVIEAGEQVANNLVKGDKTSEKISSLCKILCAFGWGKPEYKLSNGNIELIFMNAPMTKLSFRYHALALNGILNQITGKKLKMDELKISTKDQVIRIIYS